MHWHFPLNYFSRKRKNGRKSLCLQHILDSFTHRKASTNKAHVFLRKFREILGMHASLHYYYYYFFVFARIVESSLHAFCERVGRDRKKIRFSMLFFCSTRVVVFAFYQLFCEQYVHNLIFVTLEDFLRLWEREKSSHAFPLNFPTPLLTRKRRKEQGSYQHQQRALPFLS